MHCFSTGIELDAQLAACAAANLTYLPHAVVLQGDGGTINTGPRDAIFINAGATHPRQLWLDQLAPDGRLVMPLTASLNADTPDDLGMGLMLRVVRAADRYAADFFSPVGIYPCLGTRDAEAERSLRDSFARGNWESVRWLRRDPHDQTATCWFHRSDVCLST